MAGQTNPSAARLFDRNSHFGLRCPIHCNRDFHFTALTPCRVYIQWPFLELFFSFSLLRGIRVGSAGELKSRIELYINEVNEAPVVLRWKYTLETARRRLHIVYLRSWFASRGH